MFAINAIYAASGVVCVYKIINPISANKIEYI